jgi:hypothetical protein
MSQIFLSFSQNDQREAAMIREELMKGGFDVWWDSVSSWGDNWAHNLANALDNSDVMVILVSPDSMASDSVRKEMVHAVTHEKFLGRVFPTIIRPTKELPTFLRAIQSFDLTKSRTKRIQSLIESIRTALQRQPTPEEFRIATKAHG